jgi:hypothetical protein
MKLGCNIFFLITFILFFLNSFSTAEEKISSSPLINLEKLKPSFEEVEEVNDTLIKKNQLISKKKNEKTNNSSSAKFIGLDKITAKTSEIIINLGEKKKFGPLEIKVLKCKNISSATTPGSVAYLQVKDISKNENEKVFIFNGWTFSSDPTIAPFDHAIYDLQLVNCNKV